jgi:hypothetical protein
MSITPYPTLRLKITPTPSLQLKFLPALPGFNASQAQNKVNGPVPASSTDNAIVRWDGTTGRMIQNSQVTLSDGATGNIEDSAFTYRTDSGFYFGAIVSYTSGVGWPLMNLLRGRGTQSSPSLPQSGDVLGAYLIRDHDAAFNPAGGISVTGLASENHTNAARGAKVAIGTTPNGTTGIIDRLIIDQNGVAYWQMAVIEDVVALTDGPTPALDASQGNIFTLSAAGDRTIAVPTNPNNGQKIVIRHFANGGARTLSLNTASGGFRFGTSLPGLTQTLSGKTDYVGAIYSSIDNRWDVVAYAKGF